MKIEQRLLDEIRPYDHNPRKNDSAVSAVATSIREFGMTPSARSRIHVDPRKIPGEMDEQASRKARHFADYRGG